MIRHECASIFFPKLQGYMCPNSKEMIRCPRNSKTVFENELVAGNRTNSTKSMNAIGRRRLLRNGDEDEDENDTYGYYYSDYDYDYDYNYYGYYYYDGSYENLIADSD